MCVLNFDSLLDQLSVLLQILFQNIVLFFVCMLSVMKIGSRLIGKYGYGVVLILVRMFCVNGWCMCSGLLCFVCDQLLWCVMVMLNFVNVWLISGKCLGDELCIVMLLFVIVLSVRNVVILWKFLVKWNLLLLSLLLFVMYSCDVLMFLIVMLIIVRNWQNFCMCGLDVVFISVDVLLVVVVYSVKFLVVVIDVQLSQ